MKPKMETDLSEQQNKKIPKKMLVRHSAVEQYLKQQNKKIPKKMLVINSSLDQSEQ